MNTKKYISLIVALATVGSLAVAIPVFAQNAGQPAAGRGFGRGMNNKGGAPAVVGTVSAVNGNSITISGRQGFSNTATSAATIYTVDATNAKVTKNNTASTVSAIAVGDTVMVQGKVSGTSVTATNIRDGIANFGGKGVNGTGVAGTVASISGSTITISSKANTTYTVDASSAAVTKGGAASSVSAIAVGDEIMVQGTVTGTSVKATNIRDGAGQPVIQGNGQPVVAGSVSSISGNTITITNNSNVTYTVDATNAKFVVAGVTSPTISNVTTGDNLVVQGTVNGNSVVASSVIDQKVKTANTPKPQTGFGGMMGGIGNFFKHLFGF